MARSSVRLLLSAFVVLVVGLVGLGSSLAATVPKGQPDPSFGSGGLVALPVAHLLAVAVQSDGKVVAVGDDGATPIHLLVTRLNSNGSVDSSFNGGHPALGPAGSVGRAVALQSDGKIVVGGSITDSSGVTPAAMLAERFNSNGSVDGSFGSGGAAAAFAGAMQSGDGHSVLVQSDGKVVLAGSAAGSDGFQRTAFARFNTNGSLDSGFGSHGVALIDLGRYSVANALAQQSDGKVVFSGSQRGDLRTTSVLAGRLNTNGSLDTGFAHGAYLQQLAGNGAAFSAAYGVAVQPDGKVVLGGGATDGTFGATTLVVRLTSSGALDGGFGAGGVVKIPAAASGAQCGSCSGTPPPPGASAVVVSAGEIFAAGYYDQFSRKRFALWGLTGGGALDTGFGSGGAVIGPVTGTNVQATGIAIAPGGNLVISGYGSAPFSAASSFVARYGGPFVAPPPPPPLKVKVTASHKYTIGSVTGKSGLKVTVSCTVACRVSGSVTIPYNTAKRLKIAPKHGHPKTVTIASGSVTLHKSGKVTFSLHFTGSAKNALKRQKSIGATLSITASAGGTSVKSSNGITLRK